MEPILTISVAAYNVEKYIKQTLDSLAIENLNGKIEVLIVDDGSKDKTSVIAKQFEEKYPHIFRLISKDNGGYGSTINTSIQHAHGKYFKQLDGDDWFAKENVESFVTYLSTADADYVLTDYLTVYDDMPSENKVISIKNMVPYKECTFSDFDQSNDLAMHAITIKTEILKENSITIDEHCFYTDVEYDLYPLPYINKLVYVPLTIYCYRLGRTGQSMELKSSVKNYKNHERVCCSLLKYLKQDTMWDSVDNGQIKKSYIEKRLEEMVKRQYFLYVLQKYHTNTKTEYKYFDSLVKNNYISWSDNAKKEISVRLSLVFGGFFYPLICSINNIRFRKKLK